jgi:hypothetical protein
MKILILTVLVFVGGLLFFGCISHDSTTNETNNFDVLQNGSPTVSNGIGDSLPDAGDSGQGTEDSEPETGNSNAGGMVGNDSDAHGCIGSAGYVWCEEKQECIRPWEEECGSAGDQCKAYVNCTSNLDSCEEVDVNCQCSYEECNGNDCTVTYILCIEGLLCNPDEQKCDIPYEGRYSSCGDDGCTEIFIGCAEGYEINDDQTGCVRAEETDVDGTQTIAINQNTCEEAGGTWSQCAPPEGCMECESCVPTCLCNGPNDGCPTGYECIDDYYDSASEVWVCDEEEEGQLDSENY